MAEWFQSGPFVTRARVQTQAEQSLCANLGLYFFDPYHTAHNQWNRDYNAKSLSKLRRISMVEWL